MIEPATSTRPARKTQQQQRAAGNRWAETIEHVYVALNRCWCALKSISALPSEIKSKSENEGPLESALAVEKATLIVCLKVGLTPSIQGRNESVESN